MPDPLNRPDVRSGTWWLGAPLIALLASVAFTFALNAEPEFPDEWAYVSQAYFLDLFAQPDNPLWLEYPAFDLPPLPKYTTGLALKTAGYRLPPPGAARRWYENDTRTRYGDHAMLVAARRPSVAFGVLGCLAVYSLGTIAMDRRVGWIAAILTMVNPLYRMLSRRAMSDVPSEALLLSALAVGLWIWRDALVGRAGVMRLTWRALGAGVLTGLAVLAKLNGGLAVMVLTGWAILAALLVGFPWRRRATVLVTTTIAGAASYLTFVALNPFLWARPDPPLPEPIQALARQDVLERTGTVIAHRAEVSRLAPRQFPDDALDTFAQRAAAVAVQGFGRFGPLGRTVSIPDVYDPDRLVTGFDSTVRFDRRQDFGAALWLPLVVLGAVVLAREGDRRRRAGEPPTPWALLAQAAVTLVTITVFIPVAWDRYFLPIQAPANLLAAAGFVRLWDRARRATSSPRLAESPS